ncbi:MalY/PatB family protein [Streptococcus hillyeri]|uniref:cysteine-S-conjugate beta-lyase n=1 Tax=Streptococcus hillyeri TaxID=2282420 RepID=A0A3L9DS31_9STRE|nr:MalY/PatB family protein [Streptococcus hillyeri]RLY04131.1 pyridoxal phosphate-dependent aminotransferase [Streptococcus hillyeri]
MTYHFTEFPDRTLSNAYKWQKAAADKDLIPLWIADMDFITFPEMTAALEAFAKQGVYGYDGPKDSLYQAILDWEETQHGYKVAKEDVVLIEGVVPAISVAIQAFTKEDEAVLINTPVYPPFARTVTLNNRRLINNSLVEKDGHFELDFVQLEKDIIDNEVKLYVFCSPHNPGGRVWTAEELLQVGQICQKHGVILVSDEIHQDLTLFGHQNHSFNTVSPDFKEFTIILSSATKTFNIAGTKNSFALIENEVLRKLFQKRQLANNQHEVSSLGLLATEVALREGLPWLKELKTVLETNVNVVCDALAQTKIKVMKPEGTYLMWLDFSEIGLSHEEVAEVLADKAKLQLNDGLTFGREGKNHFRLNVAAPTTLIAEACERLVNTFG